MKTKKIENRITSIVQTEFCKEYFPYEMKMKEGKKYVKFLFSPQPILIEDMGMDEDELEDILDDIGKLDGMEQRIAIGALLSKDAVDEYYNGMIEELTDEENSVYNEPGVKINILEESSTRILTIDGKARPYKTIRLPLKRSPSINSGNFLNFISGIRIREDREIGGHILRTVMIKGIKLVTLDSAIKSKCIIKGRYNPQSHYQLLESIEKGLKPLHLSSEVVETKFSLFLASICPNTAIKNPNLFVRLTDILQKILMLLGDINFDQIEEIPGEQIPYFYNGKNYGEYIRGVGGQLHNSCMRYDECDHKINFYSKNADVVRMLIKKDETGKRIMARAILWKSISGQTLIDRIYFTSEQDRRDMEAYGFYKKYIGIYKTGVASKNEEQKREGKLVVKVNLDATTDFPYFDSMRAMDTLNGLFASEFTELIEYCKLNKLTSALTPIPVSVERSTVHDVEGIIELYQNGEKLKMDDNLILDINGKPIKGRLGNYVFVNFPKKGLTLRENVLKVFGFQYPIPKNILSSWVSKYNNLKTYKYLDENGKLQQGVTDKQFLIYSHTIKNYILRAESYFNYKNNSYFFSGEHGKKLLYKIRKTAAIKKAYAFKLVHLSEEGFVSLKEELSALSLKIDIQSVRPSRKFYIAPSNISIDYVLLKGIPVKYKYLQKIKI